MQTQILTNEQVLGMPVLNARLISGNCKGRISEHLFQATRRRLFLTANFTKEMLLAKIKPGLTADQFNFLDTWWYSMDGFEFVDNVPHIFEIKSRQLQHMNYPFTLTQTSAKAYPLAASLGFVCKFAIVFYLDN